MASSVLEPPPGDGPSTPIVLQPAPARSLRDFRAPVADDIKAFRGYFRDAMRSRVGLLDKVTQYVLRRKGKEIRPTLVLLAAKACGGVTPRAYRAAALVELLHTATLVHDDVVDEAERRRGAFSINALWKNKVAVLLGDFLLSRGLLLALDAGDYDLLHTVSDAVRRMSEGELLQLEKARKLDIDEETYFRIISAKTASLISACTTCGAIAATEDEAAIALMREAGEKLGLAFQIRDDLFDFGSVDVGKPLGIDLQEKKMTLPLIVSLERAEAGERRRIIRLVKKSKKSRSDIETVGRFVREQGGLDYAREAMERLAGEADALFRSLPPTPARDALIELAAYVVARKR